LRKIINTYTPGRSRLIAFIFAVIPAGNNAIAVKFGNA
jgi:hypothetical protein